MVLQHTLGRSLTRGHRVRGFSLIELMIAVGIVGVLAVAAVPGLSRAVGRSRANAQVQRVREALISARNLARVKAFCVEVSVASSAITLTPRAPGAGASCTAPGAATSTVEHYTFRDMNSEVNQVTLSPLGALMTFDTRGGVADGTVKVLNVQTPYHAARYTIWPAFGAIRRR
jgi:prepilin-type N-terminal cleavage/methylation domain-containing protein